MENKEEEKGFIPWVRSRSHIQRRREILLHFIQYDVTRKQQLQLTNHYIFHNTDKLQGVTNNVTFILLYCLLCCSSEVYIYLITLTLFSCTSPPLFYFLKKEHLLVHHTKVCMEAHKQEFCMQHHWNAFWGMGIISASFTFKFFAYVKNARQ